MNPADPLSENKRAAAIELFDAETERMEKKEMTSIFFQDFGKTRIINLNKDINSYQLSIHINLLSIISQKKSSKETYYWGSELLGLPSLFGSYTEIDTLGNWVFFGYSDD